MQASTTYFYTPQTILTDTTTGSSGAIFAGMKVTTSTNTIDITIINFITNPNSDISNINAVDFQFSNSSGINLGGATMTTSAIMRTINKTTKAYTDVSSTTTGWVLQSLLTNNGFKINGQINPPFPAAGIIGMPNAATNTYSNANGSITTPSHNPYQATKSWDFSDPLNPHYVITASGVTASTTLQNVHFFFGTGTFLSSQAYEGTPEPATFGLAAVSLAALVFAHRRRKAGHN